MANIREAMLDILACCELAERGGMEEGAALRTIRAKLAPFCSEELLESLGRRGKRSFTQVK